MLVDHASTLIEASVHYVHTDDVEGLREDGSEEHYIRDSHLRQKLVGQKLKVEWLFGSRWLVWDLLRL